MNWAKAKKILMIIGTIAGLLIFLYLLKNSINEFLISRQGFNFLWGWIFIALFLLIGVYYLQMINLWLIIKPYHQQIPFKDIVYGFSMSLIPKYIPGYVWGYLSRGERFLANNGIPVSVSWMASVLEIISTILSGVMVVGINYLLAGRLHWIILIIIVCLPFLAWLIMKYGFTFVMGLFKKKVSFQIKFELTLPKWLLVMLNSVVQWCVLGMSIWLIQLGFYGLHESLTFELFWEYISTFSLAWISGFITLFVPNGLGVREYVLKELLMNELAYTIPAANVTSVFSRILLFLAEGLWIVIALIMSLFRKKSPK
jgi:hypothetical protein